MKFQFESNAFTLNPQSYVSPNNPNEAYCQINIGLSPYNDTYVLGEPFLQNYVTILDFKHNKLKFGVNSQTVPGVLAQHKLTSTALAFLIVGIVVGVIIIGLVICKVVRKPKQEQ